MQYLGGKWKIRKTICEFLQPHVSASEGYWEPFVGGLNILPGIAHTNRLASDIHPVIHTYKAAQNGWVPPSTVSEEEYHAARNLPDADPLKHFIGFGLGFGGKYFAGYCRSTGGRQYARAAHSGLLKKVRDCYGVSFIHASYRDMPCPKGWVIYCDPPYAGTTGYSMRFDHEAFWHWAWWVSTWNKVFVSEYSAPDGWKCVLEISRNLEMQSPTKSATRIERIFTPGGEEI